MSNPRPPLRLQATLALEPGGVPPGKPLEDRAFADAEAGVFVVADGVTRTAGPGPYPDPSPSAEAAEAAVHQAVAVLMRSRPDGGPGAAHVLRAAFAAANGAVAAVNRARGLPRDFLEGDRAGAVMVIAWQHAATLHVAHIGDCALYRLRAAPAAGPARLERLTREQTAAAAAWRRSRPDDGHRGETTLVLRRDARNGAGHPAAYGCLTGEAAAAGFVETAAWPLEPGDRLFLASDGVEAVFAEPLALHRTADARALVAHAVALDAARGRKPDDKALVVIDVAAARGGAGA